MPVGRTSYCFGVPYKGSYTEVLNTSSVDGSPVTNGTVKSKAVPMHGFDNSICIDIPAFSVMYFTVKKAPERKKAAAKAAKPKTKAESAAKKTSVKKASKSTAKKKAEK